MQIKEVYSHLNGQEYLLVHRKPLWEEVQSVIDNVDAAACRTKISRERTMAGRLLYSPAAMNNSFKDGFRGNGWNESRNIFYVAPDERLLRGIYDLPNAEQKDRIEQAGYSPIMSYNQTDFVKDRVAVEVQFG